MRGRMHGFTLLELLVALAIFAVLSVLAYGGLRNVLDTRAHVAVEAGRLTALQTAFSLMERDIEQTFARSVRDNYGDARPALMGGSAGSAASLLELTRAGYRNPAARARSQLQRVAYQLQEGRLLRLTWQVLDRAPNSEPQQSELLTDVTAAEVLFYDQNLTPQRVWPLPDAGSVAPQALPRAVEVSVEITGWGRVTRLFRVPGESA